MKLFGQAALTIELNNRTAALISKKQMSLMLNSTYYVYTYRYEIQ